MRTKNFNRRQFIASSMAMIPLPFMESLMAGPTSKILKAPKQAKRMVFLGMGFGVTKSTWYPDQASQGVGYKLSEGLAPLAKHKEDFSIIQNLTHQHSRNGHSGSTFWLTGANQYAVAGKNFHNTISVDQLAARQFGSDTRFTSLQLSGRKLEGASSGHGTGLSLSWDRDGKPLSSIETPNNLFHRLFSNPKVSLEEQRKQIASKRSVLDTVYEDFKSMKHKINNSDQQKLEEYAQSLRDIETKIAKEESWLGVPMKQPDFKLLEPSRSLEGKEEVRIMYDLMAAAMQVDATRVMSYRMPADTFLQSIGASETAHLTSHYSENGGDRKAISQKRDLMHSQLLAEFFDKLKATQEVNGQSLFDNSIISFGSNISSMHNLDNCPSLIAGGGAGFKQGQNIVMKDEDTPLCNLWLTLLKGTGIEVDKFGDSTGVIEELL